MFKQLQRAERWLSRLWPGGFKRWRPRFHFIMVHYIYIFSLTIILSVIMFAGGGLRYVDALFFGSGAATQSGLNTVNVGDLYLYQQIVIMIGTCIATPIFINTCLVFVRLYWFEKRFQHIVQESQRIRRTRERSRTKSEAKEDNDVSRLEHGVNGQRIVVLNDGRRTNGGIYSETIDKGTPDAEAQLKSTSSEDIGPNGSPCQSGEQRGSETHFGLPPGLRANAGFHRNITFADEVVPPSAQHPQSERLPDHRSAEQHIAILERQRNPTDKTTLRIPGPRDFERGLVPEAIPESEGDDNVLSKDSSGEPPAKKDSLSSGSGGDSDPSSELNANDHPANKNITIDEPDHNGQRARAATFSTFNTDHRNGNESPARENFLSTLRQRARTRTFRTFSSLRTAKDEEKEKDLTPYLSWAPTIGRNSAFIGLTEEQREELGGIEYRALKTLAIVLVCYFVGFHLFGMVCLLPWILNSQYYSQLCYRNGVSPSWWGFFTAASAFSDLGYTLTRDSMISFQTAVWPLLLMTFLIIIGNTGFPCMLRFIIWFLSKLVPRGSGIWEELKFLLDHPRRCFTLLFPSKATWWLFWLLVLLNVVDLVFFFILDLNNPAVTSLPPGIRVLDGLFQAASTRTAGFAVVSLAALHPAIQVSYLVMMYISVLPIAISVRRTNVYEEQSLGVYGGKDNEDGRGQSYIGAHLRRQLSFDLWYVFLGLFIIAIVEGNRIANTNDYAFTTFSVLFEIISAYGTVGLSLGYPDYDPSFSGQFRTLSKLVIIAMQIRGRHRGLPYSLDRAILLPSDSLKIEGEAHAHLQAQSRNSNVADTDAGGVNFSKTSTRRMSTSSLDPAIGLSRIITGVLTAGPTVQKDRVNKLH